MFYVKIRADALFSTVFRGTNVGTVENVQAHRAECDTVVSGASISNNFTKDVLPVQMV